SPDDVFAHHPRDWQSNHYVYPVISRRSKGLSVGVNLNPDRACNFDCIYCQVDRTLPVTVREVDLGRLRDEVFFQMLQWAVDGSIFEHTGFGHVSQELRRLNDVAFSGDGEPTTCPHFCEAVRLVVDGLQQFDLPDAKIVLITDACYLTREPVQRGLKLMDASNGEIWAKLDAGTEAYYQKVNRPNYPLSHVIENIIEAASERPICIQSLFMRIDGEGPKGAEIDAYCEQLNYICASGGQIKEVQVYSVSRATAEANVAALSEHEKTEIVEQVKSKTGLTAVGY
ncbi:MAG: radical SAM protein, partial [Planctomycetes bacterium]|nr:radical SAM protein [Planctomycetota bacterium]